VVSGSPRMTFSSWLAKLRFATLLRLKNQHLEFGRHPCSLGSFQQTSNPNQNYGANKCHYDGTYYAAAGPDS